MPIKSFILALSFLLSSLSNAETLSVEGKVKEIWMDPNRMQVILDKDHVCGAWFTVEKSQDNFVELFALAMAAKSQNYDLLLFYNNACSNGRVWVSHGRIK